MRRPKEWLTVAIGCVLELRNKRVVDSLLRYQDVCIVVDKQPVYHSQTTRLHNDGPGCAYGAIGHLGSYAPLLDGQPAFIGPSGEMERDVDPFRSVRVAGQRTTRE